MGLDKFGRGSLADLNKNRYKSTVHINHGFTLTSDGHIDVQNKRICNLSNPKNSNDAVTKSFVDKKLHNLGDDIKKLISISKVETDAVLNSHYSEINKMQTDLKNVIMHLGSKFQVAFKNLK